MDPGECRGAGGESAVGKRIKRCGMVCEGIYNTGREMRRKRAFQNSIIEWVSRMSWSWQRARVYIRIQILVKN